MAVKDRGKRLSPGAVTFVDVTVSSAALLALFATPKQLVAAVPGQAIIFEGAVAYMPYNGTAYAGVALGEDLSIKYTDGAGLEVAQCETTGFLDQTTNQLRHIRPQAAAAAAISSITPVPNSPLVLHLLVGEITTGNSVLRLRVYYRLVPATL